MPYDFSNLDEVYVKNNLYYLPVALIESNFSGFKEEDRLIYFKPNLIGKHVHSWLVLHDIIHDQWYRSSATSWANLKQCKNSSGCGDILLFKESVMENIRFEESVPKKNIAQYITNPLLVENEEEREILKIFCKEETLVKNHINSNFFAYDKYVNNLKDNNYIYKTSDGFWCKKGDELKCKMNQQFFNQCIKK
jgi:hypothetical protein